MVPHSVELMLKGSAHLGEGRWFGLFPLKGPQSPAVTWWEGVARSRPADQVSPNWWLGLDLDLNRAWFL